MAARRKVSRYPDGSEVEETATFKYGAFVVKSLYVPIAIGIMFLGATFGGLGVLLIYLGAKGNTNISLFGQTMQTTDVGVASIFIGAVTVILTIRRLLRSIERMNEDTPKIEPTA